MSNFRISFRAFDALFTKFNAAIERSALSKGHGPMILDNYKLGYMQSFFAMEFASLSEEDQVKLFDAIEERIVSLNQKSMTLELRANDREVKIA
jgi:hypothetical protein